MKVSVAAQGGSVSASLTTASACTRLPMAALAGASTRATGTAAPQVETWKVKRPG